jgi:type 1 glutamine amidotransferase
VSSDAATVKGGTRRNALVVRGGWEGHVPVQATDGFVPYLQESGFDVRVEDSPDVYADPAVMTATDLVLQCVTMSSIDAAPLAGLRTAVEAGTGFAGWHGGIADSYRNSASYLQLVGGQFAEHPGKHPDERKGDASDNFVPHRIELTAAGREHPITAGVENFELTTEQYWVLTDDYIDVLATTTQAVRPWDPWTRPITSPAVWTRQWGRGRIFVCTPGHSLDVLADPNVRGIIERGLLWAAR